MFINFIVKIKLIFSNDEIRYNFKFRCQNLLVNKNSGRNCRLTLSNIQNNVYDEDEAEMLSTPGFWTKNVVLLLLFTYMSVTAFAFTFTQENWQFLDSFYFCLITLVNFLNFSFKFFIN